jgi:Protein of unknown function (DUF2442)
MRQPRLKAAKAEEHGRLLVRWIDGSTSLIDLSDLIARLKGLELLHDPAVFAKLRVGDFGWAAIWPDDIDIGADTLFRLAVEQRALRMDADALRNWRITNQLSEQRAANVLGLSLRHYRQLESGAKPVPQTVALACSGFDAVSMIPAA